MWYFKVTSLAYGEELFAYDSEPEAESGLKRVQAKARELQDGVKRWYSAVYEEELL